jgi:hypothetical protein
MKSKGSTVSWRNICFRGLLIIFSTLAAQAKKPHIMSFTPPTPEQAALIDRAGAQEKKMAGKLRKRIPMVQTYIQNSNPMAKWGLFRCQTNTSSAGSISINLRQSVGNSYE